jgi:prepilin-type N-terminal cleavage/methylation domain-containing protein
VYVQGMRLSAGSRGARGFSLIELLVVVSIISIIAVIAIPQLLGSREKAWAAACDDNYKAISGELQNELDSEGAHGNPNGASDVLDRVIPRHIDINPRNKTNMAYLNNHACDPFVATNSTSCQVFYCYEGANSIVSQQYEAGAIRTYTLSVQ